MVSCQLSVFYISAICKKLVSCLNVILGRMDGRMCWRRLILRWAAVKIFIVTALCYSPFSSAADAFGTPVGLAASLPQDGVASSLNSVSQKFGDQYFDFEVRQDALHVTLIQIASVSGLTLFLPMQILEGLQSRPIVGRYSVDEAFKIALDGSGLEARVTAEGRLKLSKAEAYQLASLDTVLPEYYSSPEVLYEELLVEGIRNAFVVSTQLKQEAANIVEVVSEEDIGKLPDNNVAEALQRLPGLQLERRGGEGSIVRVRGFNQNKILFNGQSFLTGLELFQSGGGNYEGSFESIPIDILTRVEVHKTPVASGIEGAVGGTINLVSRSGLDLDDFLVVSELGGDYGKYSSKTSPSVFFMLGNNWNDKVAGIFSVAYDSRVSNTDHIALFSPGGHASIKDSNVAGQQFLLPTHAEVASAQQEVNKLGVVLNLGYKFSERATVNLDWVGLHSNYVVHQDKINHHFTVSEDDQPIIDYSGPLGVLASGRFTPTDATIDSSAENNEVSANNITLRLDAALGDQWHIDAKMQVLDSSLHQSVGGITSIFSPYFVSKWIGDSTGTPFGFEMTSPTGWLWNRENTEDDATSRDFHYQSGRRPSLSYVNSEWLQDPRYLDFNNNFAHGAESSERLYSFRYDMKYVPQGYAWTHSIKFGLRLEEDDAQYDKIRYLTDYSQTVGAASPNLYDMNGGIVTLSDFNRLAAPDLSNYNGAVREANYLDLCNNGGLLAGNICDIDGDGLDDNHPIGPYGYNTAYLGWLAAVNLSTSSGLSLAEVLYGEDLARVGTMNSPSFTAKHTYTEQEGRTRKESNFFPSGGYLQNITLPDLNRVSSNIPAWIDAVTPGAPTTHFLAPLDSWIVNQKTKAFYIEGDFSLADYPLEINLGVRSVRTQLSIEKNVVDSTTKSWRITSEEFGSNGVLLSWHKEVKRRDYWNHLPAVNVIWDLDGKSRVRLSAAKVMSRPRLQDLGRGLTVNSWENSPAVQLSISPEDWGGLNSSVSNGAQGNSELMPYLITQADVGYEFYGDPANYFIAGAFYKDIKSLIYSREKVLMGEGFGNAGANITEPENQQGGRVVGLELALQKMWSTGFGIHSNFTLSDSKTKLSSFSEKDLPLPGISDEVLNFVGIYENSDWSVRLAYSWVSAYLSPQNTLRSIRYSPQESGSSRETYDFANHQNSFGRWDARIKRKLSSSVSVSLDLSNITGESQTRYLEFDNNPLAYSLSEPRLMLNIKYASF